jgi:hypothetical protein
VAFGYGNKFPADRSIGHGAACFPHRLQDSSLTRCQYKPGNTRRPVLSAILAVVTVFYSLLQLEFYVANWPHFSEILGLTTVGYGALVGFTFIIVRMDGVPISVFSPKNVMIELRRALTWE